MFSLEYIKNLINQLNDNPSTVKGNNQIKGIGGLSGQKFRSLVCELVSKIGNNVYLEIGIFQGKTILTSAAENPNIKHIGIDNFSQFDKDGKNYTKIKSKIKDMKLSNIEILEMDFKEFFSKQAITKEKNVGVLFYDAIHDYRSQLMALYNSLNFLVDGGIILVDDTNYAHVRYATYDFISAFPEFKLIYENYTNKHPKDMTPEEYKSAIDGWWNGVHIILHDPDNKVKGIKPTYESKIDQIFNKGCTLTDCNCPHMKEQIST